MGKRLRSSRHQALSFIHFAVALIAITLIAVPDAVAEKVLVDMDSVYPSGGSGYEGPIPPPTMVEVEMDVVDTPYPKAAVADTGPQALTPSATTSFDGISETPAIDGFIEKPPDTHIAVGTGAGSAGRVVEVTNNGIAIYDKTGSVVASTTDLDAFVSTSSGGFDPKVLFDQHSSRFFVVILDGKTPNPGGTSNVHIAVSTSATPGNLLTSGGGANWTAFSASALTNIGGTETWFDYPGIGADSDSLFVTGNMFNSGGSGIGTKIRVFNKADLLSGTQTFTDINVDSSVTGASPRCNRVTSTAPRITATSTSSTGLAPRPIGCGRSRAIPVLPAWSQEPMTPRAVGRPVAR